MASRRKTPRRRRSWTNGNGVISIRVGSRRSPRKFHEIQVAGPRDAGRFARLVEDMVRANPRDPLIIAVNGYQPWLEDIFNSCLQDHWSDISDLDRELQFAETMQFPEKASERGQSVPYTFIIDHMNLPHVYYWSVDMEPPPSDDYGLPKIEQFRFRVAVWQLGRGGCLVDRNVSLTIIFTRPTQVCEHVVTELMFGYLYKDGDLDQPRQDDEGLCWIFLRLYWLLTDWQNIIGAILERLAEAEKNSHQGDLPVKLRARLMHNEVDRIYEVKEYLNYHSRSLKKLQKLKDDVPKDEQSDPLWGDMDDAVEDLDQFGQSIDGLKERFNNLIDLEFNIQNAVQSDNGQFLTVIATLFLPVSYLASVFGITTITWPAIWYLYVAIPVLIFSAAFTAVFPWALRKVRKMRFPEERYQLQLKPRDFTLLGDELPDSVNVPGSKSGQPTKKRSQRPPAMDNGPPKQRERSRSRSRARSTRVGSEKSD